MTLRPDVRYRILHRHKIFENGDPNKRAVGGNFDGQKMSLGTIQFAGVVGMLIPLMWDYLKQYPEAARRDLNRDGYPLYEETLNEIYTDPLGLFDRINLYPGEIRPDNKIIEPWASAWVRVAMSAEWQQAERPYIQLYIDRAVEIVTYFNNNSTGDRMDTDRGLDIAFDIACQSWGTSLYPLGEKKYEDKLYAMIMADRNFLTSLGSVWVDNSTVRKMGILNGYFEPHKWYGQYDDKPMYQEDYDAMANAYTGAPELNEVRNKPDPQPEPIKNKVQDELDAMHHLQEREVLPSDLEISVYRGLHMTWGEMAAVIHRNNSYLWDKHLKYIRRD
jgi:hypothetical protein